jgi:hypothetical protein
MSTQSVEEIARAAVALCADVLRRFGPPPYWNDGHLRTPPIARYQVEEWGRQVLAWQNQLDQAKPSPPCDRCGLPGCTAPPAPVSWVVATTEKPARKERGR